MKTRFLPIAILLLTLCWNYSLAQWTSLGSGVSAANHKVWGIEAVDENIIWAVSYNYQTFAKPEYLIKSNNGEIPGQPSKLTTSLLRSIPSTFIRSMKTWRGWRLRMT